MMRPKENHEVKPWVKHCRCLYPVYRLAHNINTLNMPGFVCGRCGRSFEESRIKRALAMVETICIARLVETHSNPVNPTAFKSETRYITETNRRSCCDD